MNIQSLIVEGGSKLLESFIGEGLWDEARMICNEAMTIGEGVKAPVLKQQQLYNNMQVANDSISFFRNIATNKEN